MSSGRSTAGMLILASTLEARSEHRALDRFASSPPRQPCPSYDRMDARDGGEAADAKP
jgi:hypothetical protein